MGAVCVCVGGGGPRQMSYIRGWEESTDTNIVILGHVQAFQLLAWQYDKDFDKNITIY